MHMNNFHLPDHFTSIDLNDTSTSNAGCSSSTSSTSTPNKHPPTVGEKAECIIEGGVVEVDKFAGNIEKGGFFRDLTIYVVIICLFSALGGFLFGYDTGVISGAKAFTSFIDFFEHPSDAMVSFVVSAVIIGGIAGSLVSGPLADRFGRRSMLITCGAVYVVGAGLNGGARDIAMLIIGRFVVGMAVGIGSLVVPLYATEMAPARFRGALVSFNQLFIAIGIVVAYPNSRDQCIVKNNCSGWAYSFGISGAPAVILVIGMLTLPETPYYYIMKDDEDKARSVLEDLRGTMDVDRELLNMKQSYAIKQAMANSTWRELLQPSLLKAMLIGFGITSIQQLVGVNAIMYYAPNLFESMGYNTTSYLFATFVVGLVNVVVTVAGLMLVDRVGRKRLLLFGSATMAFAMTVVTIFAGLNLYNQHHSLGYITIVAVCLFILGYAVSWGSIAWVIPSELFPTHLRGKMMTVSTLGNWLSNLLVSMTFLPLYNAIGWGIFLIYTVIEILSFLFVWFCVPETRGRTLDQVPDGL